jgi:hypothetical protein
MFQHMPRPPAVGTTQCVTSVIPALCHILINTNQTAPSAVSNLAREVSHPSNIRAQHCNTLVIE